MNLFRCFLAALLSVIVTTVIAQTVRETFYDHEYGQAYYDSLNKELGRGKKLPAGYERATLQALTFFPELKNVKIDFRIRHKSSPLMVRPTVSSAVFKTKEKRTYVIFISDKSEEVDSVLMKHLPLNAQIGVVGHELSHVSFFIQQGRWGMFKVAMGNLSWKYLDRIEFETDMSTIEHGLGFQLFAWSDFVRTKLKMEKWKGVDNYIFGTEEQPKTRYMNPESIKAMMKKLPKYTSFNIQM